VNVKETQPERVPESVVKPKKIGGLDGVGHVLLHVPLLFPALYAPDQT
jgi:hypothetical protein